MASDRVAGSGTLVLDSEGLAKLAAGDPRVRGFVEASWGRRKRVVLSAVTIAEVLRGGARDAAVHWAVKRCIVRDATYAIARRAGELLGETGLSGHRCTIDAIVAATALTEERPVLILTSDPGDIQRLVEEPEQSKPSRIGVHHV